MRLQVENIKRLASGRWFQVFGILAPELNNAVGNAGGHVPCPVGVGGADSFRLEISSNDDGHGFSNQADNRKLSDGIGVLMWVRGWSFPETLQQVHDCLDGAPVQQYAPQPASRVDESWKGAAGACAGILKHAQRGFNAPVTAYLNNRGVTLPDGLRLASLLSHRGIAIMHGGKALEHRSGQWVTVPALIGLMSTSSGRVGLNIVRVTKDGYKAGDFMAGEIERITGIKPDDVKSKQLLRSQPKMRGGAVRFGNAKDVWCVGEGLETMLAVAGALGTNSAAAAGHAGLLEQVEIPDRVKRLLIFADKDRTERGEEAAHNLKKRAGDKVSVEILLPPSPVPAGQKGIDWLDDIKNLGSERIDL